MSTTAKNPFAWVEIYVDDMERAKKFYEQVFQIQLSPMQAPGEFGDLEMFCFPFDEKGDFISGALCKTSDIRPSSGGTIVYFTCEDCSIEISRVKAAGGEVIQEKSPIGDHGFCGLALDTEGNTIGFHSDK
ncbi:MAG: lactoylglutathione lyase [Flavobacteriaceae bacterium]|nr:MAG: lactoylglutathione lyase [Flavobacteriaceae bacterium]